MYMLSVLIDLAPAVNTAVIAAVNAAVGPAVIAAVNAAVGPAVNVAMQPFVRRLAMTHNRIAFLEAIDYYYYYYIYFYYILQSTLFGGYFLC